MSAESFRHAAANADPSCPKCHGAGHFKYDHNHSTICNVCCKHDMGWSQLLEHYGEKNGMWCCMAGCGTVLAENPAIAKALNGAGAG